MRRVQFEFSCIHLPGATFEGHSRLRLGIQKGKMVVDDVPANAPGATFRFAMTVKENARIGQPNLTGPYAQGTPADRFVYLCRGERDGDTWDGFRRAKVKIGHLTWAQIDAAVQAQTPIRATIEMTDAKGEPIAATVKPGHITWHVKGT